jgi:hypothetical protein
MGAYQGKVMAFVGDRCATKEPNLVRLPTAKSWEWHTGNVINNYDRFEAYYSNAAHQGTLWISGAHNGNPMAVPVLRYHAKVMKTTRELDY